MKLLPKTIVAPRPDDGLGKGMEIVLMLLVFFGIGFGLDRWLGTMPVFTIIMSVLGMVGQFVRIWYGYEARMQQHETERRAPVRPMEPAPQTETVDS